MNCWHLLKCIPSLQPQEEVSRESRLADELILSLGGMQSIEEPMREQASLKGGRFLSFTCGCPWYVYSHYTRFIGWMCSCGPVNPKEVCSETFGWFLVALHLPYFCLFTF